MDDGILGVFYSCGATLGATLGCLPSWSETENCNGCLNKLFTGQITVMHGRVRLRVLDPLSISHAFSTRYQLPGRKKLKKVRIGCALFCFRLA